MSDRSSIFAKTTKSETKFSSFLQKEMKVDEVWDCLSRLRRCEADFVFSSWKYIDDDMVLAFLRSPL